MVFAKFANSRIVRSSLTRQALRFEGLTDWRLHCLYEAQEVHGSEAKLKVAISCSTAHLPYALAVDAPESTALCREVNMDRRRRKP